MKLKGRKKTPFNLSVSPDVPKMAHRLAVLRRYSNVSEMFEAWVRREEKKEAKKHQKITPPPPSNRRAKVNGWRIKGNGFHHPRL